MPCVALKTPDLSYPVMASSPSSSDPDVTRLLEAWQAGDEGAFDSLMPLVYEELRALAHGLRRRERKDLTLSTTDLVHEAYLNLAGPGPDLNSRAHFFGVASRAMRRILVDWARKRNAAKRGGGQRPESIDENVAIQSTDIDLDTLLAVDQALEQLEAVDARMVRVVECRYFAGLSIPDTAAALGVAPATVKRDWTTARAWLKSFIQDQDGI